MDGQNDFGDLSDMLDRFEGQIDRDAESSDVIGGSEAAEPQAELQAEKKTRLTVDLTQTQFKEITSFFSAIPTITANCWKTAVRRRPPCIKI